MADIVIQCHSANELLPLLRLEQQRSEYLQYAIVYQASMICYCSKQCFWQLVIGQPRDPGSCPDPFFSRAGSATGCMRGTPYPSGCHDRPMICCSACSWNDAKLHVKCKALIGNAASSGEKYPHEISKGWRSKSFLSSRVVSVERVEF